MTLVGANVARLEPRTPSCPRHVAMKTIWTLPVQSTALLDGGVSIEVRPPRQIALSYSFEADDDARAEHELLIFDRVEAFKCTYYDARDDAMLAAYDRLVDVGETEWRQQVATNLQRRGGETSDLRHLLFNFDDGPCFEIICRGFHVERRERSN